MAQKGPTLEFYRPGCQHRSVQHDGGRAGCASTCLRAVPTQHQAAEEVHRTIWDEAQDYVGREGSVRWSLYTEHEGGKGRVWVDSMVHYI